MADDMPDDPFGVEETPTPGRPTLTSPSQSTRAHALDPDTLPWEKQPDETLQAYEAFVSYRDSKDRAVGERGYWSSVWSWGYRAHEWDKHLAKIDVDDMVRYRRLMNDRQRRVAALAQNKVVEWLGSVEPSKLKPTDAIRLLDVAVRIERTASGADPLLESALRRDDDTGAPVGDGDTFRDVIGDLGMEEPDVAKALHAVLMQRVRPQT